MKIAVIGAGAIGSIIGGLLSKAGEDVTLISRKSHVDAINQNGLILEEESERTIIQVKAAENLDFKPDLALLTMKAQDVVSSVRKVQTLLAGTQVITMQNGVRSDDDVAGLLGKENIMSVVVLFSGQFLEPGKASFSKALGKTALLIGEPFGVSTNRLQGFSILLNKALPTEISDDIRGAHWTKLLQNLNNAVPAATGLSVQEGNQYPKIRELNIRLMVEGMGVIKKAGIKTVPIPGFSLSLIETLAKMSPVESSSLMKNISESLGKQPILGSTLQSIKRGKITEIDYLNGEIVNLGKKKGIPTPVNSMMVELVHRVETTGKFLTVDELRQKLG